MIKPIYDMAPNEILAELTDLENGRIRAIANYVDYQITIHETHGTDIPMWIDEAIAIIENLGVWSSSNTDDREVFHVASFMQGF